MCSCVHRIKDQLEHIRNLFLVEYRLLLAVTLWQLHIVLELQCDLKVLFTYDYEFIFFKLKTLSPPQQQIPHHAPPKASINSKSNQIILGTNLKV